MTSSSAVIKPGPCEIMREHSASRWLPRTPISPRRTTSSSRPSRRARPCRWRSVMIKGFEAMVIECFTTARAYGVEDAVLASLAETFPGINWEKQGAYFFQRVIEHGRRRSEEVREVAETVREIGLTPWSAQGTAERQAWVADLPSEARFGPNGTKELPPSPHSRPTPHPSLPKLHHSP